MKLLKRTVRLPRRAELRRGALLALWAVGVTGLTGCGFVIPAGLIAAFASSQGGGSSASVILVDEEADLLVSRGPADPGSSPEGAGQTVIATQLRFTSTKASLLRTLRFTAGGTGDDSQLSSVRLMEDTNGDGLISDGEPQVGTSTGFNADNGVASFTGLDRAIAAGGTLDLLLAFDTPINAPENATFVAQLLEINDVGADTTTNGETKSVQVLGLPVSSGVKTISATGSLTIKLGANTPASSATFPNALSVVMAQIQLRTSSVEAINVDRVFVTHEGTGTPSQHIARADIYEDVDGDGKLQATDLPIKTNVVPGSTGTDFTGLGRALPSNSVTNWIVVYSFNGQAPDGSTFRVGLGTGVASNGVTSGQSIPPAGIPLTSSATLTIQRATLNVKVGPFPGGGQATPGRTNNTIAQLQLQAGPVEPVVVTALTVRGSGTANEQTDLSAARLVVDLNGDGNLTAGEPQLGGTVLYAANNGTVTFSGFQRELAGNATEQWIVVYDVAGGAGAGGDFQANVEAPSSFVVRGKNSALAIQPSFDAAPLTGGTLSVTGSVTMNPGPAMPPAGSPLANSADVPVVQLRLTGGVGETMRPTAILVRPSGTGDDATDVLQVDLYLDADSSGTVTAGDSLLANGTFPGNDQPLSFSNPAGLIPGDVPPAANRDLLIRYRLNGAAFHDETFTAVVNPADITVVGVTSGVTVPVGGSAAQGNTVTVRRARLSVSAGPENPGDGDALAGQPNLGVLQIRVDTGPGEDVQVTSLTVRASGTANDTSDIQTASLYRDVGTVAGAFDAGDVQIGTAQAYAADDGTVTFTAAPLYTQTANTNQKLLVTYFVSATANTPRNSRTSTNGAPDITGTGVSSTLTSQTLGGSVTGGLKTIRRGSLDVRVGPAPPPANAVFPNVQNLPVLQLELQAGFPEDVQINSVRVTADGTTDESVAVTRLELVHDVNGDGFPGTGEPVFGTSAIADDGSVNFTLAPGVLTVPRAQKRHLLLVYDLSGNAVPPGNLRLRLAATSDVTATGLTSLQAIPPGGSAVIGNQIPLQLGALTVATTAQNPVAGNVLRNASNVPMLQVAVTTNSIESARITSFTITHSGTGNAQTGLTNARLYHDVNSNGLLDSDTLLATTTFTGSTAFFAIAGGFNVPSSSTRHLLVVYNYNATPAAGHTFQTSLALNTHLGSVGNSSTLLLPVTGAPLSAGLKTLVLATLGLAAGDQQPTARNLFRNQTDVEVVQLKLTAGSAEPIEVTNVRVTPNGTGNPTTQVSRVRLYLEKDPPDGQLNGDVLVGDFANYGGGPLNIAPISSVSVPASGSKSLLLVVDHNAPAGSAGATFGAQYSVNADVTARGGVSLDPVTPTGLPPVVSVRHTIHEASLALAQGDSPPGNASVALIQTGVVVQQLKVTAGAAEPAQITSMTFTFQGTGNAQTGLTAVRLYFDSNNTGVVDGDPLLGTGTYGAGGTITFTLPPTSLEVPAGGSKQVLLVYDVGGSAANGQTFSSRLAATTDVTARGKASLLPVAVTGTTPLNGATLTVVERTLTVQSNVAIVSRNVFNNQNDLEVLSIRMTAGISEGVRVSGITFRGDPAGTGNDSGISVRLFRDDDNDGNLDGSDTPLATAQAYTGDPGAATFAVGGSIDVAAGTTVNLLIVYDLPGTASVGQTFRPRFNATTDVTAVGLVSGSVVTITGGPFPINGATLTIQSSSLALSAPTQVPAANIFRNQQGVSMVRFRATAGVLEDVKITSVTVRPSAATTGDPTDAQVRLFLDQNNNGTLEAGTDAQLGTAQAGNAMSVTFANPGGLTAVPAGGARDLLVVWDYDSTPTAGQIFAARINSGDVAAIGSTTSAVVPVSGGPFVGANQTVHEPSLAAAAGTNNPTAGNLLRVSTNVPMLQVRLTAGSPEPMRVTRVIVSALGSGNSQTDISRVELYRDDNANGVLDGDTSLGSVTAYPGGGQITFNITAGQLDVPAGGSTNLLVIYDFNAGAMPGETYQARLSVPSTDVLSTGGNSNLTVLTTGGAVTGGLKTVVDTTLAVAVGPNNPGATSAFPNSQASETIQVRLAAGTSEGVRITQLIVSGMGSGHEVNDLTDVELYLDVNGDGQVTGADTLLRNGVAYDGLNGNVTFNALTLDITAGTSRDLIVAYDFGGAAAAGSNYQAQLVPSVTTITAQGLVSGLAPTISGPTVTGGLKTLQATTLAVSVGPVPPGNSNEFSNATAVEMLQVRLTAGASEGVRVTQVIVDASGTGHDVNDLSDVELYLDVNSDGQVTGADTLLRNGVAYDNNNGMVTFLGLTLDVAAGSSRDLLVVHDYNGTGTTGTDFRASLQSANVTGRGSTSNLSATLSGATVTGGLKTLVATTLAVAVGPANPVAANVRAGETDVEVLQVRFTAGAAETVRVTQIQLTPSGLGHDVNGIAQVSLYRDANSNGILDGDPLLVSGSYAADDTLSPFNVTLDVPASGTTDLLVVINLAAGAVVNDTYATRIALNAHVTAQGLVSTQNVPMTGAPVAGPTMTVVATTGITASLSQPITTQDVFAGYSHVLMPLSLQETSGVDNVRLEQLTLTGSGSGDESTDVTFVRLYRDNAPIGELDGSDVAIGLTAYFSDNGVAAFAGLNEVIVAGTTRNFLASYVFASAAQATPGETFRATIAVGGLVLKQVSSGVGVTPVGLPLAGPLSTVRGPTVTTVTGPTPPPSGVASGGDSRGVLQLEVGVNQAAPLTLTGLTLTASGGGNDNSGLARASLHEDRDRDGQLGPDDRLLGDLTPAYAADNGTATFAISETIAANTSATWLVSYTLSAAQVANQDYTLSATAVTTTATSAGLPVAGATLTVYGALTVRPSALGPARTRLALSSPNQALALFDLTTDTAEAASVTSLAVTARGSADDAADFSNIRAYLDDGDGVFEPGAGDGAPLVTIGAFAADNARLELGPLGLVIPGNSTRSVWVSADVGGATAGTQVRLAVEQPGDVGVSGQTSGSSVVRGTSANGPLHTLGFDTSLFGGPTAVALSVATATTQDVVNADLDLDGDLDLAVLRGDGMVEVFVNNGSGAFTSNAVIAAAAANPQNLVVGDLNRDGLPDLVVVFADTVSFFRNNGAGGYLAPVNHTEVGSQFRDVALIDVEDDGDLDVVVLDRGATLRVRGRLNDGTGVLTTTAALGLASAPKRMAVADVDRDGRLDLSVTNDANEVRLLTGNGTFFVSTDTDNVVGVDGLTTVDVDGDGFSDVVALDPALSLLRPLKSSGTLGVAGLTSQTPTASAPGGQTGPAQVRASDFDSDGLADLVIPHSTVVGVVFRLGGLDLPFPTGGASSSLAGGLAPDRVSVGDLNRDGDQDVVVGSTATALGQVQVFLGDGSGDGSSSLAVPTSATWTESANSVAIADVNSDGRMDLIAVSDRIGVFPQTSPLRFGALADVSVGAICSRVLARDVNGDGRVDLVLALTSLATDRVELRLGNGDGTFGAAVQAVLSGDTNPSDLTLADLDRDGNLDAIVAETSTPGIQVLRGTGASFGNALGGDRYTAATAVNAIVSVDFNRDGRQDVAAICSGGTAEVRLGTTGFGLGGVSNVTLAAGIGTPQCAVAVDLNGDGIQDLIVGGALGVELLQGNGAGGFISQGTLTGVSDVRGVAARDLDRDGDLDLVVAHGGGLAVFTKGASFTFGAAVITSLSGSAARSLAAGDLDGDGEVDVVVGTNRREVVRVLGR